MDEIKYHLTYDEYDALEEKCAEFRKKAEQQAMDDGIADFDIYEMWPTEDEIKKLDLSKGIAPYIEFLVFWSTQNLDSEKMNNLAYEEYKKGKKAVTQILYKYLEIGDTYI